MGFWEWLDGLFVEDQHASRKRPLYMDGFYRARAKQMGTIVVDTPSGLCPNSPCVGQMVVLQRRLLGNFRVDTWECGSCHLRLHHKIPRVIAAPRMDTPASCSMCHQKPMHMGFTICVDCINGVSGPARSELARARELSEAEAYAKIEDRRTGKVRIYTIGDMSKCVTKVGDTELCDWCREMAATHASPDHSTPHARICARCWHGYEFMTTDGSMATDADVENSIRRNSKMDEKELKAVGTEEGALEQTSTEAEVIAEDNGVTETPAAEPISNAPAAVSADGEEGEAISEPQEQNEQEQRANADEDGGDAVQS